MQHLQKTWGRVSVMVNQESNKNHCSERPPGARIDQSQPCRATNHESRVTSRQSPPDGLPLGLPPSRPNVTIWCSMTTANPQLSTASRPRVGIPWRTSHEEANRITNKLQYYVDAVTFAEGEPVPLSLQLSAKDLAAQIKDLDAFVLPGGPADVNPALYRALRREKTHDADPNREKTDFAILEHAFASGKPDLAICSGSHSIGREQVSQR